MSTKLGKIDAFQGLRAVAFIAIFLCHTPLGNFASLGAWGVSVFFMMSGFLMMLSNLNKQNDPKFGFSFAWNKIRALYPLHLFTMLLFAVYAMNNGVGIIKTVIDMGIHTFLVQMWIPNTVFYTTLNGPAWYLCTSFFLYLCFPLIFKFIRKYINKHRSYIALSLLAVIQIAVSAVAYFCTNTDHSAWFNTQWLVYYFPPTRLIDFAVGCFLGYLYFLRTKDSSGAKKVPKVFMVLAEVFVCIVIVFSCIIYTNNYGILGSRAVKYALLFMPTTACLIWFVASREGVLHRILSIKPFVMIGNLSPYAFLIHMVSLRYCGLLFNLLRYENSILLSVISFVLTIVASIIWKRFWNNVKQG